MNELTTFNKMTSMEISEVIGKEHKHVMRDIRDEIEKLESGGVSNESKFGLVEYTDAKGEKRPCYQLSKEGVLQLAARYDAVVRAKLIELAMKQEEKPLHIDSKFLFSIAAQLEEKEKENQVLQLENKAKSQIINELKPKADYTDTILKNKGLVTITQIAKDYGMTGQAMNELLHDLKIQYKQSDQWLLYREHQDKGYTHSETIPIIRKGGIPDITMNTKWTQKGRLFIYGLLKGVGILPVIEREQKGA
jgi:phage antirepressor YoqD-like protein